MTQKTWIVVLIVCVVVLGLGLIIIDNHNRYLEGVASGSSDSVTARAIYDFIAEMNPKASLKEYLNFPNVLLKECQEHHLDYRLVLAVIEIESRFKSDEVSSVGAVGLMQVMPSTAIETEPDLKYKSQRQVVKYLLVPENNVKVGIHYLIKQLERYDNNYRKALSVYNTGYSNSKVGSGYAKQVQKSYQKNQRPFSFSSSYNIIQHPYSSYTVHR